MALDKLVNSTVLDAALRYTANRIRAKTGGSENLLFNMSEENPKGFGDAVDDIQSGGITPTGTKEITITENGTTTEDVTNYASVEITTNVSSGGGDFVEAYMTQETTVSDYEFAIPQNFMRGAPSKTVNLLNGRMDAWYGSQYAFNNMPNLEILVLPKATRVSDSVCGESVPKLKVVDFPNVSVRVEAKVCRGAPALDTIILRRNSVCVLASDNVFSASGGHFASGGTGGKIYIPKALYDHIGDGTDLDYTAATKWSTICSRANITWLPIEGSEYDGVYADGTPIPTT